MLKNWCFFQEKIENILLISPRKWLYRADTQRWNSYYSHSEYCLCCCCHSHYHWNSDCLTLHIDLFYFQNYLHVKALSPELASSVDSLLLESLPARTADCCWIIYYYFWSNRWKVRFTLILIVFSPLKDCYCFGDYYVHLIMAIVEMFTTTATQYLQTDCYCCCDCPAHDESCYCYYYWNSIAVVCCCIVLNWTIMDAIEVQAAILHSTQSYCLYWEDLNWCNDYYSLHCCGWCSASCAIAARSHEGWKTYFKDERGGCCLSQIKPEKCVCSILFQMYFFVLVFPKNLTIILCYFFGWDWCKRQAPSS